MTISSRQWKGLHGTAFTLIELMIVIVIIGIAAAIAVPMISSAASFQIRSAANMVAADLEYAKSLAIGTGQNYSVVFDAANNRYWIVAGTGGTVDTAIEHPVKKGFKYVIDFDSDADRRLDDVTVTNPDFGGSSTVTFDSLGSPSNGGTVVLQAGGLTRTITVTPVTGFISVSE
jgi:prepilin-type N-terminal cleavage/methylation domain-containing protein